MKKITFAVLLFMGIYVFGSSKMIAQDTPAQSGDPTGCSSDAASDMARLQSNIRLLAKQFVAANLTLTDREAADFWPVYEQYSADLGKISDAEIALIKEYADAYGTLTDDQADSLTRRWLDESTSAAQLRQKYMPIFRKVLSGIEAAAFFQLDHHISLVIDVILASQIPLVQSQDERNGDQTEERLKDRDECVQI